MSLVGIAVVFCVFVVNVLSSDNTTLRKNVIRNERALVFPASSTIGIFIAIAIPLDLPNRNVFLSYNFEANYNMPYLGSDIFPGIDQRFEVDFEAEDAAADDPNADIEPISRHLGDDTPATVDTKPKSKKKKRKKGKKKGKKKKTKQQSEIKSKRSIPIDSLITRKNLYHVLEEKFKHNGYKGKPCMLRTICEVNRDKIGFYNGVTGSVIDVIFQPSSSEHEGLSDDYYIAEKNGLKRDCTMYHAVCPESILELFSKEYDPPDWGKIDQLYSKTQSN